MSYPLGRLYDEAVLVEERENGKIITEAQLLQLAVSGILSKDSRKLFTKRLKSLLVRVRANWRLFDTSDD